MRNKGLIIALTVIVTLLSFYYISFTYVAQGIQEEATAQSKDSTGVVDTGKKQAYLDSLYDKPVYNFLGMVPYTYKEVKDMELALGLDLQGGMHVVLEVSPVEILKALAGAQAENPLFKQALKKATLAQGTSQESFEKLFYAAFKETAGSDKLASIFSNAQNSAKIRSTSSDKEVEKMIDDEIDGAVDRSFEILRSRIDRFGAIQPNLQRIQGTGRILVELPGVENPQRVRKLLQGTAQLDFYDVYSLGEIQGSLLAVNDYLISQNKLKKEGKAESTDTTSSVDELAADPLAADSTGAAKPDSSALAAKADSTAKDTLADKISPLFSLRDRNYPYTLHYSIKDTAQVNRILKQPKVQALLPTDLMFLWDWKEDKKTGAMELVPIRKSKGGKSLLTGDAISDAREDVSQDGKASYGISMQMNPAGAKKWKKITQDAIKDSQNKRRVAIVLDNVVYSAPTVQSEIPNGSSSITGNFTQEDAKDIANILKAGKLPAPVRIVEEVIVGPTLGQEAIESGLMSLLAGLLVVVVLMVAYYNKGGLIADIALVFNVIFTLGFLASLNSVLTLPGLAGIVLSLGMSVDANVLIFERIKEERKNGKGMRAAIDAGFDKAFSSIFDSNITTILTGAILFLLGSGPIKGFAVTLMIGIACSFFTSVYISRVILIWLTKGANAETAVSFTTPLSKNLFQNLNFDFVKYRKVAYITSIVLLLFGAAATVMNHGLNLGVDFKGGRSYIVEFKNDIVASDLKASLSDEFQGTGTEVKTYGSSKKIKVTTSYLVQDESEKGDEVVEAALVKGLKEFNKGEFHILSSNKVGATVADDILQSSWQSIFASLVGIFIYVLIRFRKWQFGFGGIVALFHDTLMVLAMFAILQLFGIAAFEVDQVIIAALLTIVGFSINDTVIVFDRVREFGEEYYKLDMKDMLNKSINSTLSRTIMTTVTVLVTVIILCVFGGESLRGFSISLLVGVVFGSYSTIFIAIPMVLDLRSKADKEAKKIG